MRLLLLFAAIFVHAAGAFAGPVPASAASPAPEGTPLLASPDPVAIAKEGKALLSITIAPDASPAIRETAAELAAFLHRITGAEFAITEGKDAKGLVLGTLAQFPDDSLKGPLAIKNAHDGLEAFVIRSGGGRVRLLANTDLGVSHAAYRFLELNGCRWFFSAPAWEVIPRTGELVFGWNEDARPEMISRNIWFGLTNDRHWEPGDPGSGAAYNTWKKRNRMADSLAIRASHRWHAIPADFKAEFAAHPEYFALTEGERKGPQFCVTNPGLQKIVSAYADAYFAKNPTADMMPFDPADGVGWCTCPECTKLGHQSNQAFYLANIVAKSLQASYPGKYVGLLAYSWHSNPPPFSLEPNVYVMLTNGMNASKFTFDELFSMWAKTGRPFGIYEYYSYWHKDHSLLPGGGTSNNWDALGERMRRYVQHGVNSLSAESANNWGLNGLLYYLSNKLMWNSSANVVSLRKDFYEKAFGPAAAAMERYFERLNQANNPLAGTTLLQQCTDDLAEAAAAANGHPEVQARVQALQEYLVYNYLGQKAEATGDMEEKKKFVLQWFTWAFRTRNNYMNDWMGFRHAMSRVAQKELGEPTWAWRVTKQNPWKDPKPVTSAEIVQWFQTMKTDLGNAPEFSEVQYSRQIALADFGTGNSMERLQKLAPQATYLMASMTGEPLRFKLEISPEGKFETRDAKYSVKDSGGDTVAQGELTAGSHEMEIKVPAAGIYRFTCRRGGAGWDITLPEGLNSALLFTRGEPTRPSSIRPAYFYVPKGAREFSVYAFGNQSLTVKGPGGRKAFSGPLQGGCIAVEVSPDEAGKVWSIEGRVSDLWLFNVPTILSSNPRWIFVPQDLAARDDLPVVLP